MSALSEDTYEATPPSGKSARVTRREQRRSRSISSAIAWLLATLLFAGTALADRGLGECEPPRPSGEIEIKVLTMTPGGELWSVFGHNGFWVRQPGQADRIYNFGVISDEHPDLARRFVTGTLDFYLGTRTYRSMLSYYGQQKRTIVAQTLDLPRPMTEELVSFLEREALPENRLYRYHWIDANCATRLRDAIDLTLSGSLAEQHSGMSEYTPRDEVLRHLGPHRLLWFAWNFSVGSSADAPLSQWRLMFLPDRLYEALGASYVIWPDGSRRPLVSDQCRLLEGEYGWASQEPPRRDLALWALGLVLGGLLLVVARAGVRSRLARFVAALFVGGLGLVAGSMGTLSAWLWIASSYEGHWRNANLLVVNPLALLLLPVAFVILFRFQSLIRPSRILVLALAGLGVVGLVVALLPIVPQPTLGHTGFFLPMLVALAAESKKLFPPDL